MTGSSRSSHRGAAAPRRLRAERPGREMPGVAPPASSRLDRTFAALRARGERALVAYFTAGDPSLADTSRLVLAAVERGADIVELGIPFSDPLADGPVIQRAAHRALAAGATLPRVLELARDLRVETEVPLVFLTYYNSVLAFGLKAFCATAAEAGVDGVIVADLPPEEAGPLAAEARSRGLDLIHLVAPTSPPARMRMIARASTGFVYMVALTGVTGARTEVPPDLVDHLRALRRVTDKPICVGFGIGTAEQAAAVGRLADGVIVGSAVVRLVERHAGSPGLLVEVGRFIASLKATLRGGRE
jgi:tryptophan synthase alpha chain